MLNLTKEQIEENKKRVRDILKRKRESRIPNKFEPSKNTDIEKKESNVNVNFGMDNNQILIGLDDIRNAVESIKETNSVDIKNFSEVVDKLGSLETAISESKVEIDNKDIIKGLLKIEKKIKEPKVSDYNDLLEFIGDELTEIKGRFTFDSIEKILEEIRDKKVDTSGIKIVDDKGKSVDWSKMGKGHIEYRGGNTGMTDVQLTQLLDGLTDIKTELDDVSIAKNKGTMSTNNSTTTPLGIDAVFTGVADDIKDYAAINISVFADQASAACGLSVEWSQDGTNWDEKMTVAIGASKVESYEFGVRARYFRLVYTNGAIAQGAFRLQVIYHPVRTREGARCLCVDIDPREFAKTVRAVLAAKKPDGTYSNIHSTSGGNLKVAIEETEGNAAVGDGTSLVTTAGTRVQLPDVDCKRVFIQALEDNAGTIVIGGVTVVAAVGTRRGMALFSTQGQWFNVSNINLLYIDSTSNGDTVAYFYEN